MTRLEPLKQQIQRRNDLRAPLIQRDNRLFEHLHRYGGHPLGHHDDTSAFDLEHRIQALGEYGDLVQKRQGATTRVEK